MIFFTPLGNGLSTCLMVSNVFNPDVSFFGSCHEINPPYSGLLSHSLFSAHMWVWFDAYDIDNLKKLNDNYGHRKGDEVLSTLGGIIKKSIRKYDIGARYGGDEFVVVLPDAESNDKDIVIERIEEAFKRDANEYKDIQLGLSFGHSDNTSQTVEAIIKEADRILYMNKANKKNELAKI